VSAVEGQSETAQSVLDLQNPWPNLAPLFKVIAIMGTCFVSSACYAFEDLVMLKTNKSLLVLAYSVCIDCID